MSSSPAETTLHSATSDTYETSAQSYSDNVTRFTVLFAEDLIRSAMRHALQAKAILEIGCGTGAFGLAYLSCFPDGIRGQTIVFTDVSPAMVRIAEKVIRAKSSSSCQTQFLFRVADGTGLDGFADSSFDMVTSVFGVFLIPNRAAALREIRRALKRDAVFATTAWTTTEHNEALREAGFGANLQDSMALMKVMPRGTSPDERRPQPMPQFVLDWFDRDKIRETLTEDGRFRNVQVYRSIHSVAFGGVGDMWNAFVSSSPHGAAMISGEDPEQAALARAAFGRYVAVDGDQDGTVFVQAAANIVLAS